MLTIGVDIGGTKVAAGVVDDNGEIVEHTLRPTAADRPDVVAQTVADVVRELSRGRAVVAVGVGAAGFVDETRSVVRFAPNLAWREEPLQKKISDLVGLPVIIENDANAMAWGETRFGAGRGQSHVVCLTLGTGIGGGIVIGGDLYRGRWGMGAELGHMQVLPGGRPCGCGNVGCWEQYASGQSLVKDARQIAAEEPERAATLLGLAGGKIEGEEVTEAARQGDDASLAAFAALADWLGQGMADLAAVLDPGCFIVGGGVSRAADLFIDRARQAYGKGAAPHASIVDISDPAAPFLLSLLPTPEPPPGAPYADFSGRGGWSGPHNINHHQHHPDVQKQGDLLYIAHFNAGLRIYDVSNTRLPREVGYFVPPDPVRRYGPMPEGELVAQSEDVVVDRRGYIYVSDKNQGVWILRYTGR
ncbi:ROK family glucokinase [Nonomuraea sp. NPDC004297]